MFKVQIPPGVDPERFTAAVLEELSGKTILRSAQFLAKFVEDGLLPADVAQAILDTYYLGEGEP